VIAKVSRDFQKMIKSTQLSRVDQREREKGTSDSRPSSTLANLSKKKDTEKTKVGAMGGRWKFT